MSNIRDFQHGEDSPETVMMNVLTDAQFNVDPQVRKNQAQGAAARQHAMSNIGNAMFFTMLRHM